ncbi:hypothetical protein [Portibacter lacus]|uniref:Uncharacterized protein n=1 Tax=Portibacter lacus TaxID=1099794 RepID=A0AA37SQ32_9BACT|nr:hypothetical protein [Portibacter lacus]GLR17845.1 hypothetical protein GCM10007940_24600 [Portibacter lacus]
MVYSKMCATLSKGIPKSIEIPGTLELGIKDKIAIIIVQETTINIFFPKILKNILLLDAGEDNFGVLPN